MMKNKGLLATLFITAFFLVAGAVMAQPFEGTIAFNKVNGAVTTQYKYYVKGNNVRVEELGENQEILATLLVFIEKNEVIALSPDRKLYMTVPNKRPPREIKYTIDKTFNKKEIAGYKCTEWKVVSKDEDRSISYWVGGDNFDFFVPLLKTLNRKDNVAAYFTKLEGTAGVFPMLGIERLVNGAEVSRLEVTKIQKEELKDKLFEIPAGYKKFDNVYKELDQQDN